MLGRRDMLRWKLLGNTICCKHESPLSLINSGGPRTHLYLLYMFGSDPRTSLASNGTPNYNSAPNRLSGDVSIKGDVMCGSELVIEGEVAGTITSTGTLTIGAHGKVTGDIEAGFVTIQGSVEGNVLARQRCALKAGSNLQGDVEAPRLAVDETASFVGKAIITANRDHFEGLELKSCVGGTGH